MVKKPERIFNCDCNGEGLIVHQFECCDEWCDQTTVAVTRNPGMEDDCSYYTVGISYWGSGPYDDGRLNWRGRIRLAWQVLRKGHPWHDMVALNLGVAKSFANRILYLVNKMEKKQKKLESPGVPYMEKD